MKEVKFRAWDRKAKAMFPVHHMAFGKISNELESISGVDIHHPDSDSSGNVSYGGSVLKKTGNPMLPKFEMMQFTGLKDKNGKEIYEGDIVEYSYYRDYGQSGEYEQRTATIEWNDMRAGFSPFYHWDSYKCEMEKVEVIGNIYENPELLEGAER